MSPLKEGETPPLMNVGTSLPVGTLTVEGVGVYEPRPDITPHEVALLLHLFVAGSLSHGVSLDYAAYIQEHGLGRHFRRP